MGVGEAGATALARSLAKNTALAHLDLSENPIGDTGAEALAAALATTSTLETLTLNGCRIGAHGARALFAALCDDATLQSLSIAGNAIRSALPALEATCLVELVLHGTRAFPFDPDSHFSLLSLSVGFAVAPGCSLGRDDFAALARLVQNDATPGDDVTDEEADDGDDDDDDCSFRRLDVSDNHVGSEAAVLLVSALASNKSLLELSLAGYAHTSLL